MNRLIETGGIYIFLGMGFLLVALFMCLVYKAYLTRCRHTWAVRDTYSVSNGTATPEDIIYISQCSQCGKLHRSKVANH